jgi:rod shape-determining protein MreC
MPLIYLSRTSNQLNHYCSYLATPLLYCSAYIARPLYNVSQYFHSYAAIHDENRKLKKNIEQLQNENISLKATKYFLDRSEEIAQFKERYSMNKAIVSKILLKHFSSHEQYFYINQGSQAGIKPDMIAAYQFQLLGKVTDVFPWYSKVQLITDAHCTVAAYSEEERYQGISHGTNNVKECIMEYIDLHASIAKDEIIISSGQSMIFPEGFSLGSVINVKKNDAYQTVSLKPLIDFENIDFCYVIDQKDIPAF